MWLITEAPVTVRTAHGDVKLLLGVPHELSDAIGERVLQRHGVAAGHPARLATDPEPARQFQIPRVSAAEQGASRDSCRVE